MQIVFGEKVLVTQKSRDLEIFNKEACSKCEAKNILALFLKLYCSLNDFVVSVATLKKNKFNDFREFQ